MRSDRLTPLVYDELKRLADRFMKRERPGHTLQATAIVHEAYERLTAMDVPWVDRRHFFSDRCPPHAKDPGRSCQGRRSTDKRAGSVTLFEIKEHDAEAPRHRVRHPSRSTRH